MLITRFFNFGTILFLVILGLILVITGCSTPVVDSVCADGEDGCPCLDNGECNDDLSCGDDDMCRSDDDADPGDHSDADSDSDSDGDGDQEEQDDPDEDDESAADSADDDDSPQESADSNVDDDKDDGDTQDSSDNTGSDNDSVDTDEDDTSDTGADEDSSDNTGSDKDPVDTDEDTDEDTGEDDGNDTGEDTGEDTEEDIFDDTGEDTDGDTGDEPDTEENPDTEEEEDSSTVPAHVRDPDLPTYSFSDPGARFPFPQNVDYPYGVQSTNVTHEHVASWYESWNSRYLQNCNGMIMPGTDPSSTSKVEAQGFAMITAAYMADKATFDGLYAFYKNKLQPSSCGLMAWKTNCGGVEDAGAATDGDIDVASGLIVAHWQWPDDGYDDGAREIIEHLKGMTTECGNVTAVIPGCGSGNWKWGGCNETDISYYSPGFFRYFAEISGDDMWNKLADDTHTIRDAAANSNTGLVPDWQSTSGTAGSGSRAGHYGFDAIRTPFKHALDYLWNGNEKAGAWCEKITNWANNEGVTRIVDQYQLNGSASGSNHNMAVVGSLAVCASANTQEVVDAFVEESGKLKDDYWYSGYLGNLYLLAMTGNMWDAKIMGI